MAGDYDSDALTGLDPWLAGIMRGLSPAKRRRMATKLGQALRRSNLERIKDNVEPDGGEMEARKPRLDKRGRLRKKAGGKMFRKLRYAKRWRIKARADSVELAPKGNSQIPAIHHFGQKAIIGRTPDGKKIFHRYPRRRLLGFADGDEDLALEIAAQLIDQES